MRKARVEEGEGERKWTFSGNVLQKRMRSQPNHFYIHVKIEDLQL
jgi:hypothetical protein